MNQEKQKNISDILLCLIAFSIPFPIIFCNLTIIFFILFTLFSKKYYTHFFELFKERKTMILIFSGFYFAHILFMANSENIKEGLFDLEKKLTLVLFPIFILMNINVDTKSVQKALLTFTYATFVSISICEVHSVYFSQCFDVFKVENFTRDALMTPIQSFMHPTDLAIYSVFSISTICIFLYHQRSKLTRAFIFTVSILIFVFLLAVFMLASRIPLVALTVIAIFLMSASLYKKLSKITLITFITAVLTCLLGFIYFVKPMRDRFTEIFTDTSELPYGAHHNSSNIRLATNFCSFQLIKANPIIGYGTGDVQLGLNDCYKAHNLSSILYKDSYNSHNQYFQTWIGLGMIGFIFLILSICLPIISSLKSKNILYFTFLVLVSICCLTESYFGHQKGVVFYAFFNSMLCVANYRSEKLFQVSTNKY